MPADPPLAENEVVLLRRREGDSVLLKLKRGPQALEGRGVVDLSAEIGRAPGGIVEWGGAQYELVRPRLPDLLAGLRRKAQIVTPKDAQFLLYLAGIGPGARVAEAGAGSGALTLVVAHAVGPSGRVVSYDRRPDFLDVARRNLDSAGLSDRVDFRHRDVAAEGLEAEGWDAVILDLPEPWAVLESARATLQPGGRVAVYTPTYNQLERTVRTLRELRFDEIRSVELLERSLHVGEGGTRPEFEMLGHTGFLTGARRGVLPWS
ncbi:MAG TPA: tRNA (adenine-N1)-methyltransferase [Thermoplasmata archaeon]|nr:tRNA (adenine-N1)-methyltransferase [Thermoplasmata archaeon]